MSSSSKEKTAAAKKAGKQEDSLIYCGPNLPKGILNQFTVYRGGLPKHLDSYFEKCPAIKRLFVPVDNMAATMQAIKTAGTSESVWFGQVVEFAQGGAK